MATHKQTGKNKRSQTPYTRAQPPVRLEAEFLVSVPDLARCPPGDQPEIAFAGRSNAGKSSVLNRLTDNRHTAKVSKTPGRTQLLNMFDVRGGGRIVDLPGYGYAKASRTSQQQWQESVNEYLSFRENLVGVVLIMDIRHPMQPYDLELLNWASESGMPIRVLLNKADKLSNSARQKTLNTVREQMGDHEHLSLQVFSASKGTGLDALFTLLQEWLSQAPLANLDDPVSDP